MRSVLAAASVAGAIALGIAGISAGDADARRVGLTRPGAALAQGPVLAGPRVVWSELGCFGGCLLGREDQFDRFRVWSVRRSGRPTRVARVNGLANDGEGDSDLVSFGVFGTRLALQRSTGSSTRYSSYRSDANSVRLGRMAAGFEQVFHCSKSGIGAFGSTEAAVALGAETLAYDSQSCGDRSELALRNVNTGATRTIEQPPGSRLTLIRAAGRFVALARDLTATSGQRRTEFAVLDTSTGAELFTGTVPEFSLDDLSVDEAGRLAVSRDGFTCKGTVSWYSIEEPSEHRLPLVACSGGVRLAGGRVLAFVRSGTARSLRVSDLAGRVRTVVRLGRIRHPARVDGTLGSPDFVDWDGRRAVYALRDCAGGYGIHETVASRRPASAGTERCPVRLRSRRLQVSRRGRIRLPLVCPRGCRGFVAFELGRRRLPSYAQDFSLRRGARRGPVVALGNERARLVARRRGLRVRLVLDGFNRADRQRKFVRRVLLTR